jgi:hypothetical protein
MRGKFLDLSSKAARGFLSFMLSLHFYVTDIIFKIFILYVNLYAEVMKVFSLESYHIFTKSTYSLTYSMEQSPS